MSERGNKRYYWLKLKRDFFKRHDIRIIESQENGKDYVLFYLKMLLLNPLWAVHMVLSTK